MLQRVTLICAVLLLAGSCAFAQDAVVEFEGRYWMPELAAKARVEESNIGTDVNLKTDLGLEDENFPEGRFIWNTGPNSKLRFFYTQAKFEGDKAITRSIDFDGKTYTAGAQVSSKLDLQYFGIGWIWEFINVSEGKIKAGTILEVKGVAGKSALDAPSLALSESEEFLAGLPTGGLVFEINPFKAVKPYDKKEIWKNFGFYGEIAGMSAGKYGYFFDTEAGVKFDLCKYSSITGGYRLVSLKAKDSPDYAKIELKGPFVSAAIKF